MTGSPACETQQPDTRRYPELALRVVGSEHHGRILRIQSPKCTIGSAAGCTLRLRAPGVHGVHCLVLRGPGGLAVRSWTADTRLNGQAFVDAQLLPGDRLAIGPLEFEILNPLALPQATCLTSELPTAPAEENRPRQIEQEAKAALAARDALALRVAEHDQHVARLSAQLTEAEQLVEQLRREAANAPQVAALDDAITGPSAEELAAVQQQVTALTKELAQAQQALEIEQALRQAEQAELTEELQQARAKTQQEHARWEQEHSRLLSEHAHAQAVASAQVDKQREYREMEVAMTHWREQANERLAKIADLEQRIAALETQRDSATGDQHQLRVELEQGARELDAETERLLEKEAALDKRLQAWEAEQAQQTAELAAQRQQIEELSVALAEQRSAVERAAADVLQQQEQLSAAQEALRLAQETAVPPAPPRDFAAEHEQLEQLTERLTQQQTIIERQTVELAEARDRLAAEQAGLAEERAAFARQQAEWQATCTQAAERREVPAPEAIEAEPYEPQSASDIIAKLSASGLWKDEAVPEPVAAEPTAPEPAWKSLVETPQLKATPAPAAEEEDSIEAYMQRLLQRVSGDSDNAPRRTPGHEAVAASHAALAVPQEVKPVAAPVAEEPAQEPFNFQTYVPRTAPELTANLAAMRELANSSARTAIDTSSKRRQTKNATSKLVLSAGAIGTAIVLAWLSMRTHSLLSYYAALSAGAASLVWGLHAGYLWLTAHRHATQFDHEPAADRETEHTIEQETPAEEAN